MYTSSNAYFLNIIVPINHHKITNLLIAQDRLRVSLTDSLLDRNSTLFFSVLSVYIGAGAMIEHVIPRRSEINRTGELKVFASLKICHWWGQWQYEIIL